MPFSVFHTTAIAQVREDYLSAQEALEATRELKRRGAKGVNVTDGNGRGIEDWQLELLASAGAASA